MPQTIIQLNSMTKEQWDALFDFSSDEEVAATKNGTLNSLDVPYQDGDSPRSSTLSFEQYLDHEDENFIDDSSMSKLEKLLVRSYFANAQVEISTVKCAIDQEKQDKMLSLFKYHEVVQGHLEIINAKKQQFKTAFKRNKIDLSQYTTLCRSLDLLEQDLAESCLMETLEEIKKWTKTRVLRDEQDNQNNFLFQNDRAAFNFVLNFIEEIKSFSIKIEEIEKLALRFFGSYQDEPVIKFLLKGLQNKKNILDKKLVECYRLLFAKYIDKWKSKALEKFRVMKKKKDFLHLS